jgi:hypothetical protein
MRKSVIVTVDIKIVDDDLRDKEAINKISKAACIPRGKFRLYIPRNNPELEPPGHEWPFLRFIIKSELSKLKRQGHTLVRVVFVQKI